MQRRYKCSDDVLRM